MRKGLMSAALPAAASAVLACWFTFGAAAAATASIPSVPGGSTVGAVTGTVTQHQALAPVTGLRNTLTQQHVATAPGVSPSAPVGSASANAVKLDPLMTCVSCTDASAGQSGSSSSAQAITLLGQNVSGGSANTSGAPNGSGNLIALPANPLLSLMIADWMASAKSGMSSSRAALVDLSAAGGQITVAVLEADSAANWTSSGTTSTSKGDGSTSGVDLNLGKGALVIILLHSEAHSSGNGTAYIASINGNEILSSGQTNNAITIAIPGLITITLLNVNASGGSVSATVGTISNLGGMPGEVAGLFNTSGSGATSSVQPLVQPPVQPPHITVPKTGLPWSGGNALRLILLALALFAGGLSALAVARHRRQDAVPVGR